MTPSEIADWLEGLASDEMVQDTRLNQAAATIRDMEAMENRTVYELDQVSDAIGTVRFMDPPDGGSVTLAEQVSRMHDALTGAEDKLKIATEALELLWDKYKELADSGDAGFWKAEDTDEGKKVMDALARIKETK